MFEKLVHEQVEQMQTSIAALKPGETVKLHGWTIWRSKERMVDGGQLVLVDCVWLEDCHGRYAMFKGFDEEKVERMLEMIAESRERSGARQVVKFAGTAREAVC